MSQFRLSEHFIEKFKTIKPPFGFNGLGELVYMRTYSREKENGKNEVWWETIKRVIEGTYNMQKDWIESNGLHWNAGQAQRSAQEMFERMFYMKFLPPGRGLWAMGSPITEEKKLYAALNNCAFVSTENIKEDLSKPFVFLMDMSCLGVGVGFDTRGAGRFEIKGLDKNKEAEHYIIPDTREGWVESVNKLILSYFLHRPLVTYDYSVIRPEGSPIKGFGGISSGPEPLIKLHEELHVVLERNSGSVITVRTITDMMNMIGKCVVSGNVRRSAEIAFGDPDSEEFLDLKDYTKNPERESYGWSSNNSIFAKVGMSYRLAAERTGKNGEPGYAWLTNMQAYSRMTDKPDHKDKRVRGGNPCLEQSLEPYELCCLVETYPDNHESLDDYKRTLKFAYLYAKTVTLGKTHWPETNRVMLRNRRIGCSMSGIAQFLTSRGLNTLKEWCEEGYQTIESWDEMYSDWFAIPKSIKKTSIKPSGTISLLAGATPGMHYPEAVHYIRRMRLGTTSDLVPALKKAGYHVEVDVANPNTTMVVEVPVCVGKNLRTIDQVSLWEQVSLAAFLQKYWADNQVSCTVTFDKKKDVDQIEPILNFFQYQLKGISFLPKQNKSNSDYKQLPYEEIDAETFERMSSGLKKLDFRKVSHEQADVEKFCDGDKCILQ